MTKSCFFIFVFIWVRWTIPRFRYDQLMNLGWTMLIPLAMFNVVLTGLSQLLNYRLTTMWIGLVIGFCALMVYDAMTFKKKKVAII